MKHINSVGGIPLVSFCFLVNHNKILEFTKVILALDGLFKQELLLVIDPIMITMGLYPKTYLSILYSLNKAKSWLMKMVCTFSLNRRTQNPSLPGGFSMTKVLTSIP